MVLGPQAEKVNNWAIKIYGPQSTWGIPATLDDHFYRHGKDFNSKNINDYTNKANKFYKNQNKYENFVGIDGNTRVYDSNTNTFGSYNPDGTTKTFMKPTSKNYWQNQINRWKVK